MPHGIEIGVIFVRLLLAESDYFVEVSDAFLCLGRNLSLISLISL